MKTISIKKKDVERKYYLVDAEGKVLGRVAAKIALALSGKRKTDYTPHVDNGDFVVVVNAAKITVTGDIYSLFRLSQRIENKELRDSFKDKACDGYTACGKGHVT